MTKNKLIKITEDIRGLGSNILLQVNSCIINPSLVEKFYIGVLEREITILSDVIVLLKTNSEKNLTSVFILLRVLIDDFIRLFSVYSRTCKMEEEVEKIIADAHYHNFKIMNESAEINHNYFDGLHPSLFTKEIIEKNKEIFKKNNDNDRFFECKTKFKFKKLEPISNVFKTLKKDYIKVNSNIHSYVVYKSLTQHVHYSNLSSDKNHKIKNAEINQLEEVLLYAYKMLNIQFGFFYQNCKLQNWDDLQKVGNCFTFSTNKN